jgi:hypothetical protein
MTNKRKIEILEIALSKIENNLKAFICNAILTSCDDSEKFEMEAWFESKKPSINQYSEFLKDSHWTGTHKWWRDYEKEPRIRFLETLINELKQEIA